MRKQIVMLLALSIKTASLYGMDTGAIMNKLDNAIKALANDSTKLNEARNALREAEQAFQGDPVMTPRLQQRRNAVDQARQLSDIGSLSNAQVGKLTNSLQTLFGIWRAAKMDIIADAANARIIEGFNRIKAAVTTWDDQPLQMLLAALEEIGRNYFIDLSGTNRALFSQTKDAVSNVLEMRGLPVGTMTTYTPGGTSQQIGTRLPGTSQTPYTVTTTTPAAAAPTVPTSQYPTVPETGTFLPLPTEPEVPVLPQQATKVRLPQPRMGGALTQPIIEEYVPGPGEYEYSGKQQYAISQGPQRAVSYPAPALTPETGALVPYRGAGEVVPYQQPLTSETGALVPYRGAGEVVPYQQPLTPETGALVPYRGAGELVPVVSPERATTVIYKGQRGTITQASFADLASQLVQLTQQVQMLRAAMPR